MMLNTRFTQTCVVLALGLSQSANAAIGLDRTQ